LVRHRKKTAEENAAGPNLASSLDAAAMGSNFAYPRADGIPKTAPGKVRTGTSARRSRGLGARSNLRKKNQGRGRNVMEFPLGAVDRKKKTNGETKKEMI